MNFRGENVKMAVLPGVLGCRTLRRTIQVRLRSKTLRLPGCKAISAVTGGDS